MPNFLDDPIGFIAAWLYDLLTGWGVPGGVADFLLMLLGAFTLTLLAMLFVIFLIWYERKLLGRIQDRLGPNRVGPWGIFQSFADMLKIFVKEYITPEGADPVPYNMAPILSVASVLLVWSVIPFTSNIIGVDLQVGLLFVIAAGGFSELSIMMAGWGSNNKYSLLAGFRAVAMLVSYEVPMIIALLVPAMLAGSLNLNDIVEAQTVPFVLMAPVAAIVFFITQVAESGRSPFDVVEAESELVAGFNTEYSGLKFGMFYVAEFLHAFTISLLFSTIFLGGWRGPGVEQFPLLGLLYLVVKTFLVYFIVILFRGSLPRFRMDQMLNLNWKVLTPLSLIAVFLTALVDKTLVEIGLGGPELGMLLARTLILLIANGIVLWLGGRIMGKNVPPDRPIVSKERPLATNRDHSSA
jgi:NADH-quinone oxidoreductase subunit H